MVSGYGQLNQPQRIAAVALHHAGGMDHMSISRLLGCDKSTSTRTYQRAKQSANAADDCDLNTLLQCDYLKPSTQDSHREEHRGSKPRAEPGSKLAVIVRHGGLANIKTASLLRLPILLFEMRSWRVKLRKRRLRCMKDQVTNSAVYWASLVTTMLGGESEEGSQDLSSLGWIVTRCLIFCRNRSMFRLMLVIDMRLGSGGMQRRKVIIAEVRQWRRQ